MPKRSHLVDAQRLLALRVAKAWSQERLAEKAQCDPKTVVKAEGGNPLDLRTISALAEALGVEPQELMRSDMVGNQSVSVSPATQLFVKPKADASSAETDGEHEDITVTPPRNGLKVSARVDRRLDVSKTRALAGVVLAAILIGVGAIAGWRDRHGSMMMPFQNLRMRKITYSGKVLQATISPDGKYLAYVLDEGAGERSLRVRRIRDGAETEMLPPGTVSCAGLAFTPDGDFLYFLRGDHRKARSRSLYRMPAFGGRLQNIIEDVDSAVSFSPDGRQMVFVRDSEEDGSSIVVANTDGTDEQILARQVRWMYWNLAWSPDGRKIAALVTDNVFEKPLELRLIDPKSGKEEVVYSGNDIEFLSSIQWMPGNRGLLVAFFNMRSQQSGIGTFWLSERKILPITHDFNHYLNFSLSRDGKLMIATVSSLDNELYVMSSQPDQHGTTKAVDKHFREARWLPDGHLLAVDDEGRIIRMQPDGSDRAILLTDGHATLGLSVCPGGRYALFAGGRTIQRLDLWNSDSVRLTGGPVDRDPICSPDGTSFIYSRLEQGNGPARRVLMRMAVDGGPTLQLSDDNTSSYAFSPDGREIAELAAERPHTDGPMRTSSGQMAVEFLSPAGGPVLRRIVISGDIRPNAPLQYSADGQAVYYATCCDNIIRQPISGGTPSAMTSFHGKLILTFDYDWKREKLAFVGHSNGSDVVLISEASE